MPADVDFRNYESAHVHPIALSASGNAALRRQHARRGGCRSSTSRATARSRFAGDVPVGLDPVSLAVRPGTSEVWVVNHLSDSVSVVDVAARKLVATIAVGDEPTDVVFASGRAFVTPRRQPGPRARLRCRVARAGRHARSSSRDDPRALATNAAGTEVYAVALESGNRTTALVRGPGDGRRRTAAAESAALAPRSARRRTSGSSCSSTRRAASGEDETGDNWSGDVDFTLPDSDVFVIDADAATPSSSARRAASGRSCSTSPCIPARGSSGSRTPRRATWSASSPNLRGHMVRHAATRVNAGERRGAAHADLNPHIDYGVTPGPPAEIANSLAQPATASFNADGSTYYVAAFGSAQGRRAERSSGAVTRASPWAAARAASRSTKRRSGSTS